MGFAISPGFADNIMPVVSNEAYSTAWTNSRKVPTKAQFSGALAGVTGSKPANTVFAAPNGFAGTPSFRALVPGDIPNLDASKITSGVFASARLGSGTANNTVFLRGDNTWSNTLTGNLTVQNGGYVFDSAKMLTAKVGTATAGVQTQNSRKIQLEGSIWRTDTAAAQDASVHIYSKPNQTNAASVALPGLALDFGTQQSFIYRTKPTDYLTTQILLGNPGYSAWGGILEVYYDGTFSFRDTSGNYSPLQTTKIAGGSSAYPLLNLVSDYRPEIRSMFNSPVVIAGGRSPALFGDNVGNGGSEYLDVQMQTRIGNNNNTRSAFIVKSASGQTAPLIETQTNSSAINFRVYESGKTVIGTDTDTGGKLQVRAASGAQIRKEYSALVYTEDTTDPSGVRTIDIVGATPLNNWKDDGRFEGKLEIKTGSALLARVEGVLKKFYSDQPVVGLTDTIAYSLTIPANTLSVNGDELEFEFVGTFAANTNVKWVAVQFGGINLFFSDDVTSSGNWKVEGSMVRESATVARVEAEYHTNTDKLIEYGRLTSGINFAASTDLKLVISADTNNTDNIARLGVIKFVANGAN